MIESWKSHQWKSNKNDGMLVCAMSAGTSSNQARANAMVQGYAAHCGWVVDVACHTIFAAATKKQFSN